MGELFELFRTFFRIGAFTFGGGYAMLSIIQREVADNKKWATEEELLDYFAVAQCTPGVIAVNTATFIGYKRKGIPGAIMATIGVITPSLIIILAIASLISNFMHLKLVTHIFGGIRVAVAVLIINAVGTMGKKAMGDKLCIMIGLCAFVLSVIFNLSPVFIVAAAALVGITAQNKREGNIK